MRKLFIMSLAFFLFVVPTITVCADDKIDFILDTPIVLSYDNFANTELFSSDENALLCFMYYLRYLDYLYYDFYDEEKNGFRMSMPQLFGIAKYIFENVSAGNIPDVITKVDADVSCPVLRDMLKNNPDSVAQVSSDFVFDTFFDAANMQQGQLLTKTADNQQISAESDDRSRRIDANMNGNPDDIYNITVQFTGMDIPYARTQMFHYIQMYVVDRYCANGTAEFSCVPTPTLNCDLLPNTTYLQRDLDFMCNNSNWQYYVIGDGLYELRLKRK